MILQVSHFDHLEPGPKISKADTKIETLQGFKISPQTHANQVMSDKQQKKEFKGRFITTTESVQSMSAPLI